MQNNKVAGWHEVQEMRAYLVPPIARVGEDDPEAEVAGILMLPMITGVGSQLRDWAEEVARTLGRTTLVWDPWHGASSDDTPLEGLRDRLNRLDDATALEEIRRLIDYMHDQLGLRRIAVIGWCLGGRYALLAGARDPRLSGVVAMHPTLPAGEAGRGEFDAVAASAAIEAPVLVHYPGRDHIVSIESFERLQATLEARTAAATVLAVHPRAHHGFSDRRNHHDPDNASAFRLAWPQVLAFLTSTTSTFDAISPTEGNPMPRLTTAKQCQDLKYTGQEPIAGQKSRTADMDLKVTRYRIDTDGVAIVWFHRPGRGNSWTNRMHAEYRHLMDMLDKDPAVRVVVVTGTGRQFCVGADAKALEKYAEDEDRDYAASVDPSQMAQPGVGIDAAFETDIAWHWGMRVPVIAAINGACAGIATAIATFADLRYMAEGAKWTTSTPRLGLPAEYGLPWVLPRIVGLSNAADLVFTGRIVLAEELDRMGYLNGCYAREGFLERVLETARMIATQVSPASATAAKRQLYRDVMRHDVRASIEEAKDMIQTMMSQPDYKEGVSALTEKRRPRFGAPTIEPRRPLSP